MILIMALDNWQFMIYFIRLTETYSTSMSLMIFDTRSTAHGGGGSFKDRKPIGEVRWCESWMAEQTH